MAKQQRDITIVATILTDDLPADIKRIEALLDHGTVRDSFDAAEVDLVSIVVVDEGHLYHVG
jgi:hypothetical protein